MNALLAGQSALLDLVLINAMLALSQYAVLRAGVFSLATAGLAAIGAYTAGALTVSLGVPALLGGLAAAGAGCAMALILSIPLARLRGVFQAIATLAFGQIVLSLALFATPVTGGGTGLNGIPKAATTTVLAIALAVVVYLLHSLYASGTGRAFDTIRQDETAAVSLGIAVSRHHTLAFALSGAIAGIAGALLAYHNYSLVPEEFGFGLLTATLAAVVLGGRRSIAGPVVGAAILTCLPELARPLAENRMIITGALLTAVIVYLPHGVVDTLEIRIRARRRRLGHEAMTPGAPISEERSAGL